MPIKPFDEVGDHSDRSGLAGTTQDHDSLALLTVSNCPVLGRFFVCAILTLATALSVPVRLMATDLPNAAIAAAVADLARPAVDTVRDANRFDERAE